MSLNPWFALILGILIGWLLNWLLGMLFFRRQHMEFAARLADAEAQLKAREGELGAARARVSALEAELAAAKAAALPPAKVETPKADLTEVAVAVSVAAAADGVKADTPSGAAPEDEVKTAEPAGEAPGGALAGIAGAAHGIGLAGAAVAGLGAVALAAAAGEESTAAAPEPAVEDEAPEAVVEAPAAESETPEVIPAAPEAHDGLGAEAPADGTDGEDPAAGFAASAVKFGAIEGAVAAPAIGLGGAAVAAGVAAATAAGLASLSDTESEPPTETTLPTPVARIEADDLTQIKGIGPKYAGLLNAAGITTYVALARTPAERLETIIDAPAWRQVDYRDWIAEARALAEAPRRMVVGDDLTTLEGIGPVYEAKLKHAGIATFAQLAAADEDRLKETVQAPAWRRVNYGEWIAQAKLAASGDTEGLKSLQAELFSRGGDNIALIAGVGEKTAAILSAAGITTYAALADSTPDDLAEINKAGGGRAGDYEAWIEEAKVRAAGKRVKRTTRGAGSIAEPRVSCPQDLSRVKGIGSAFETKLYAVGIGTYWELSEIADVDLVRVLELQDFQAVDIVALKADALKLAEETDAVGRYWDGTPPDNFEQLEGIGEVYERRLYEAGICTFRALAEVSEDRLQEICQAPDWRRPDYAAWIAQAKRLTA